MDARAVSTSIHARPWFQLAGVLACAAALWAGELPRVGTFSPDSYAYALLGRSVWTSHRFESPAVRDFGGLRALPQPSRSFPPLWPALVGGTDALTGLGVRASLPLTAGVLLATLIVGAALARTLASGSPLLVWLAFPIFVLTDEGYRAELTSGRAIPLSMLLTLGGVALAVGTVGGVRVRMRAAAAGLLFGAAMLCRFDELVFCAGAPAVTYLLLRRRVGGGEAIRAALAMAGAMLLVFAPWGVRNWIMFGSPLASDNGGTAASTWPNAVAMSWWAAGAAPPTAFEAPARWAGQRLRYLHGNLKLLWRVTHGAAVLALAGVLWGWRRFTPAQQAFVAFAVWHAAAKLAVISLTPYRFVRYLSAIHLTVLVIALVLVDLLATERRWTAAVRRAAVAIVLLAVAARGVAGVRGKPDPAPGEEAQRRRAEAALLALAPHAPPAALIASPDAEALAYYGGRRTIYLPFNCDSRRDCADWFATFRPDVVVAPRAQVRALGLEDRVVADAGEDVVALPAPLGGR